MNPTNPSFPNGNISFSLQEAQRAHQQGRLQDAMINYQRVLASDPRHFDALHGLGILYGQLGRFAEAAQCMADAGAIRPKNFAVHFNRGKALQALGDFEEARLSYNKAIRLKSDSADAYNNRGNVLMAMQRYDESLADYDRAISLKPNYELAHLNRSALLLKLRRHDEALASCDRALALRPDFAQAYNNRGNILRDMGNPEEALAAYDKALALAPQVAEFHSHRGHALKELHRFDEAMDSYDRAIALRPDFAEAICDKGYLALLLGDFQKGWPLHESRWKPGELDHLRCPMWMGEPLAGRSILLHSEQGMGDVIQFVRYVSMVAALGAKVILGVPTALTGLISTLEGDYTLVTQGDDLPPFDLHCPLMSLPFVFKTTLETIPATVPYLSADPRKRAAWRERLGAKRGLRVGLAWAGNPNHKNDVRRSMPLHILAPLLALDGEFHSVQKGVKDEDREALEKFTQLHDHQDALEDFTDTAALISEMDVVISVDTSVAHLAGALAKPVWVMLPAMPDFRWLLERSDSPWYPTARLFRQQVAGDWHAVVNAVCAALRAQKFSI